MAIATESGHWYTMAGEPAYRQPKKSGDGMRNTTLRDARSLDLVPSVTTIMGVAGKPGIVAWRIRQMMLACLTSPHVEQHKRGILTEDELIDRIETDAEEARRVAANAGVALHAALQRALSGEPYDAQYAHHVKAVLAHLEVDGYDNGDITDGTLTPELAFTSQRDGFGGKVDLVYCPYPEDVWLSDAVIDESGQETRDRCAARVEKYGRPVVWDFKSQDFSSPGVTRTGKGGTARAYDDMVMQLAGYAHGIGLPEAEVRNLFVSRSHPGCIVEHVWSDNDMKHGWRKFTTLLSYYRLSHRFPYQYELGNPPVVIQRHGETGGQEHE